MLSAAVRDSGQHLFFRRLRELQAILSREDTRGLQDECVTTALRTNSIIVFPAKGFSSKPHCPTGMRTPSNSGFGKRRDEDDWYSATLSDQSIPKINPAHTRQLHVGDQTGAVVDPRRAQEILSRFEHESDETKRPQKALHCRAN
jgi:hypothetical protein